MHHSLSSVGVLSTLLLTAALVIPATHPAGANTGPQCGDVLTEDTTLTADLHCDGDGLIIGANGITVSGNQFEILGSGAKGSVGIENPGFDDTTLDFVQVRGFESGVVYRAGAADNLISDSWVTDNKRYGLVYFNSHANRTVEIIVENNGLKRPGKYGAGVALFKSHGNSIYDVYPDANGVGIFLERASGNEIRATGSTGNSMHGIWLVDSDKNQLLDNRASGNQLHGIAIDRKSTGNYLEGNTTSSNERLGIEALATVQDGANNRASLNGDRRECVGIACIPDPDA